MGGFELMKGECRSCGAEIYWTETEKGRRMPVDVEPSEEGNLRLIWMYNAGSPKLLAKHDKDSDQLELEEDLLNKYKSHFGTCDQSKRLEEEMNIGADIVVQAFYVGFALLVLCVLLTGCAAIIGHGIHLFKSNREGASDKTNNETKEER